jgi:sterol carrier protein 2
MTGKFQQKSSTLQPLSFSLIPGIPIYNVNNNCSTGASALLLAKQLVETGQNDCVMALGFEKMERGSLSNKYEDRTNPLGKLNWFF